MSDKKKRKLSDYIEVQLPGTSEPIRVVRGDVSDKVWAELQDQSSNPKSVAKLSEDDASGKFTNADVLELADNPGAKPGLFDQRMQQMLGQLKDPFQRASEIRAQLKARGYSVEDNTVSKPAAQGSPSEWKDMPKEEKSGSPGMSVRGQMLDLAKGATKPKMDFGEGVDLRPEGERTRDMPELDLRENPGTTTLPEVDGGALVAEENLKRAVKESEAAAQMKEGLDFTTPESNLKAAVARNATETPGYQEVTDNNDTTVSPVPVKPMLFDSKVYVDPEAPPEPGLLDKAASVIGRLPEAAGRFFGGGEAPSATPDEEAATNAAPTTVSVKPAPGFASAFAPPPASAAGGAPVSGRGSVTVKSRPGVATPAAPRYDPVMEAVNNERALMEGASTLAADANAKKADIERQRLMQEKSLREQALTDAHKLEEQRAAAAAAYSKTLTDGQSALNELTQQRRELLNQKVDPNRYWNEAGAGQKATSLMAAALFGWSGQGMNYLQHLQGLVDRDIKLQQDELKRRGGVYDDLVGDQKNIIALAKERGMSDMAAVEAARVARYRELEDRMQMLATDAGVQGVNPNLALTLSGLAQERAKSESNLAKFLQQKANQDAQTAQGWAKLRQDRDAMTLRFGDGANGGKGVPMKPGEKQTMAEYLSMGDTLGRMMSEYRAVRGDSTALTGAVSKKLGVGGTTKSNRWDKAMDRYTQLIGKPLEGGVVREQDTARYKGSYIPDVSDTDELAAEKQQGLVDYAVSKYTNQYNAHVASNAEGIEKYPPPEMYRRFLESKLAPAEPLPGETPR